MLLCACSNFPAMDKLEKGPKEIFSPEIQKVTHINNCHHDDFMKLIIYGMSYRVGFVAPGRARRIGELQIRRAVHQTQSTHRRRNVKQR